MHESELRNLITNAGELHTPPPLPEEGIPKQTLPEWIRCSLKWGSLPFVLLDIYARKIALFFIKPPFIQEGMCKKRGNCCYFISMEAKKGFLQKLQVWWMTEVHGFYFRTEKAIHLWGKQRHVLGCRYLQKDGSCAQYKIRPKICREWPVIEAFSSPRVLKGCGYTVKARSKEIQQWMEGS